MFKSISAGNSPHTVLGGSLFEIFHTSAKFLSVKAELTHPPRFFLITLTFFLAAHTEQRQQPALQPFDVPLGRMCRKTTYSDALFFPTGGSKEERCGRISCEGPFLYVSHTMVCLSVVRSHFLAGKISLRLLTHTMALGDHRK